MVKQNIYVIFGKYCFGVISDVKYCYIEIVQHIDSGCELIIYAQNQKDTLKALGLTKMHKTVEKPDNEQIRGMIKTVAHLVTVAE